jgi:hypothetical protein
MSGRTEYELDGDSFGGMVIAVVCSNCSAHGPFGLNGEENLNRTEARRAWNTRADDRAA